MSASQRKTNTAAFTGALKQVFQIHKNIVAELCAKLDVVTDECKLLKANSNIPKSSEKCESCIHLEKMNRSLQEHFNSLLNEKDIGMKALEQKLQNLSGKANSVSSQSQNGKILLKENMTTKQDLLREQTMSSKKSDTSWQALSSNVCPAPLSPCGQGKIMHLSETELIKGHSKLRLTRHGKRHSHYVEEQRETKRVRLSPGAAVQNCNASDENLKLKENDVSRFDEMIFVADTVSSTQPRNFKQTLKDVDENSDNEQSQECLVVPETIDVSFNSWPEHETQVQKHDDDDNPKEVVGCAKRNCQPETAEGSHNISGGHKESLQTENITFLNDGSISEIGNSSVENTHVIPDKKQANRKTQLLKESLRKSSFQGKNSNECVFQKSGWDSKISGKEAVTKGSLLNSVSMKEDISKVNDVILINEGPSHHIDVTENTSGSSYAFKENCHLLRKKSGVLVRNAANQKAAESAICDSKMNSLDRDNSEGIERENFKSLRQTTLSQAFTDKLIDTCETRRGLRKVGIPFTEGEEKLQIAEAIRRSLKYFRNTQNSSRGSEDASLESNFQVPISSPELGSLKTKNVQKCNSILEEELPRSSLELDSVKIKNVRKNNSTIAERKISEHMLENSSNCAKLLPPSLQEPTKVNNQEHRGTTDATKSTEHRKHLLNSANTKLKAGKISNFANTNLKAGKISNFTALEPNGSLNPDIHLTAYLYSEVTEQQNVNQTFCDLDETLAPNVISQTPNTSQITKLNTETNRQVQSQQDDSELHVQLNDGLQDDDESILNNSVFSNDDDDSEMIEPSPQQTCQSRSQLYCSIPASSSSYKFTNKKPQGATKSVLQEIESEMVNNEDSIMDESWYLLHDKSGLNLDRSTELNSIQNSPSQELLDSFDRVPISEDIEFPHVSVVRKKSERSKLEGFSCKQCYEYYKNSGLSEEALQQKKNDCSRHRERYRAPETPEHFWSLGFPDTAEMLERGQKHNSKESPVAAHRAPRRRQRLEKKF